MGESYLDKDLGKASAARITLLDSEGNVLFDSLEDPTELANHSNRPEFIQAEKEGYAGDSALIQRHFQSRIFTVR